MIIFEILAEIFNTFLAAFVTIPLDNTLSLLFVVANFLLQLFGASIEG